MLAPSSFTSAGYRATELWYTPRALLATPLKRYAYSYVLWPRASISRPPCPFLLYGFGTRPCSSNSDLRVVRKISVPDLRISRFGRLLKLPGGPSRRPKIRLFAPKQPIVGLSDDRRVPATRLFGLNMPPMGSPGRGYRFGAACVKI